MKHKEEIFICLLILVTLGGLICWKAENRPLGAGGEDTYLRIEINEGE